MSKIIDSLDPVWLGSQLKASRMAAGMTQSDIAKALEVARTTIVAIEKGERRVSSRELSAFGRLYEKPLSDWLGGKPSHAPLIPQFRSTQRDDDYSNEIAKGVSELESLARDYCQLEEVTGVRPRQSYPEPYEIRIPGSTAEQRGEEIAAEERRRLSLGDNPIQDLRALLEQSVGLRIFYLKLPQTISGIYAYSEELSGCIAINREHPPHRASWSLAHEYGHFLTTRYFADVSFWNGSNWGKSYDEKLADSFAKNFLMPRVGVNGSLSSLISSHGKGAVTVADVLTLAHRYRVSVEAMFRRLEDLKRLSLGTWDKLKAQKGFRPDEARRTLGLQDSRDREPMLPFRYRMLAMEAFRQEQSQLTESQLARYLRSDLVTARDELERLSLMADQDQEDGFESISLDVSQVLERV